MAFSDFSSLDGTARAPRPVRPIGNFAILGGLSSYRGHYNPDQPRVPKGHRDGGQWTREGASSDADQEKTTSLVFGKSLDAAANADWTLHYAAFRPLQGARAISRLFRFTKGHHIVPLAEVIRRSQFMTDEAIDYFSRRTIGAGQLSDQKDKQNPHRSYHPEHSPYNSAVGAEMDRFITEKGISPQNKMTLKQAAELFDRVRASTDPRIKDYNASIETYLSKGRPRFRWPYRGGGRPE